MKTLFAVLFFSFLFASCKKSALENSNETLPTGTTISTGSFTSNAHPTSGKASIIKDAAGKTYLVIENLNSDNGPDLRIWLSPNTNGAPYQELGFLKAVSGNFFYELDDSINYTTNNRVLIWCKQFSVLFGHAVLL